MSEAHIFNLFTWNTLINSNICSLKMKTYFFVTLLPFYISVHYQQYGTDIYINYRFKTKPQKFN